MTMGPMAVDGQAAAADGPATAHGRTAVVFVVFHVEFSTKRCSASNTNASIAKFS
jgi:hypothetical protein